MKKFKLKELIFLAILSAVMLLLSSLIMPVVMFTQITALRQLFAAPIFALFSVIAIRRVPKIGTLTIVGLLTGLVLLFMSVIMFFNNFFGALIVELLVLLIFRDYKKRGAIIFAATLYMPVTIPISIYTSMLLKGKTLADMLSSTFDLIVMPIGTVILSLLGAFLGMKIADEMKKAGKLKSLDESH